MTSYQDDEFGTVPIRRLARTKYVRVRVLPGGTLQATMPPFASLRSLGQLIESSRVSLRRAIIDSQQQGPPVYESSMTIGAAHHIELSEGTTRSARRSGPVINWVIPAGSTYLDPENQAVVRRAVRRALDEQARAYLPRRLAYLAREYGFAYETVRYSNPKGRWGSCSSKGVISLNVALMNLPKELIDYVLIHELAHTKQLNHSDRFWQIVATIYPEYKTAKKSLKSYSPYL